MCHLGPTPTKAVEGVEGWIKVQGPNHGREGGCQHGDCDNHLVAPMLVREEGVVMGGGRGRRDDVMKGGDRVGWMARYCWDGEDWGGGHSLVSFGPPNDNEEASGSLDDISRGAVPFPGET